MVFMSVFDVANSLFSFLVCNTSLYESLVFLIKKEIEICCSRIADKIYFLLTSLVLCKYHVFPLQINVSYYR